MRKILSMVLVLSLVLGSFGFAFAAPADVEGTDYEDAVTRLSALEILSGFPDGTFRPDETVTRAQFAKIMVTALGVGEAAKYAAGETKFADVAADHWAAGYINVASDMGIINGYGNGTFGPEDQVTYAQAVTMIVRGLGYEPKAQAMGGYPGGYLAVAAEKEITEDVNVVNTLAATRGDVALMVDASLDVPMMVQTTWGQYPEYEEDEDKTLLTDKLGVDELEVQVTAVPNSDSNLDEDEIKLDGDTYTLIGEFDVDKLLGLEVTAWADGDDVFFIDVDTDSDDIYFDTVTAADEDEVTIYLEDDTFEWADNAKIFVNFEETDGEDVPVDAYGYFVIEDDEVLVANLFNFNELDAGVVFEIEDGIYNYVDNAGNDDELDLEDYEDGVFIYNDKFQLVDEDEIDVNSAIFAWETSDELYLVVKNETAEGNLDRVKDTEVRIDGTDYDAAYNGASYSDDGFDNFGVYDAIAKLDNLGDEDVVAVLDLNGEVLFIYGDAEATSSTMYGVVTYAEVKSDAEATIFNKDGEEVDYVFEERTDATNIDYDSSSMNYFGDSVNSNLQFAAMKFKLNADGKIDEDYLAGDGSIDIIDYSASSFATLTKSVDKNYVMVGSSKYYIDEDTIFMTALDSDGKLDPAVLNYDDIYEVAIDSNNEVFVYGTAGKDADMIIFLNKDFVGADDDYFYGVVQNDPWKDGSDYVVEIDVQGEGVEEYVVANEAHFSEGLVVKFHFNSDDEIVRDAVGGADSDGVFTNDGDYLTGTDDGTVKVASDAVVYSLDSDGDIDEKVKTSKIDTYDGLTYILDEDGILVAAVVTETSTPATPSEADYTLDTFTTTSVTVTGAVYDASANNYVIKITDPADSSFAAVYDTDSLADASDDQLDFSFGALTSNRTYKIELFEASDVDTILATFTKFLLP